MTPEQEKDLLDGHAKLKADFGTLSAKVPELETKLAAKDVEIAELKKGHSHLSQGADLTAFKTAYPDVPENVFHATAPDKRQEVGKAIQEQFTKVKGAKPLTDPKDPISLWAAAGGIGPTDDAGIAAEQAERTKKIAAAKAAGDPLGMLKAKGSAVMNHLARSFGAPVGA